MRAFLFAVIGSAGQIVPNASGKVIGSTRIGIGTGTLHQVYY